MRHPNILSFLHSTEVETHDGSTSKVTIYIVTEPVMPLSDKIKELGLKSTQRYMILNSSNEHHRIGHGYIACTNTLIYSNKSCHVTVLYVFSLILDLSFDLIMFAIVILIISETLFSL